MSNNQSMQLYERAEQALRSNRSLTSSFTGRRKDKSIKWSAERDYAIEIVRTNPDNFRGCDIGSLGTALLDLSSTGLTLSPRLGLAYLVPYKGMVKLEISYKGMEHMCYRSGMLKQINIGLVRKGDHFVERHTGDGPGFEHIPVLVQPGAGAQPQPIIACWVMTHFSNGGRHYERMDSYDFESVMDAAKQKNKGKLPFTYQKWLGEMLKKAAIRRAWKHWPKDESMRESIELINRNSTPMEFGPSPNEPAFEPDEQGDITVSEKQAQQLRQMVADEFTDDDEEMSAKRAENWMTGLAEKYSVATIESLPEQLFDQAVETINNRISAVRATRK